MSREEEWVCPFFLFKEFEGLKQVGSGKEGINREGFFFLSSDRKIRKMEVDKYIRGECSVLISKLFLFLLVFHLVS